MPQDETTFAQFYARQVNTVYRICYVRLKNQMDAEDVTQEVFLRAMQQPDPYRTVVYLFYFEGYSGMEIAGMLGKKESTVRSLLHRAKKRLSKVLGGEPYAKSGR